MTRATLFQLPQIQTPETTLLTKIGLTGQIPGFLDFIEGKAEVLILNPIRNIENINNVINILKQENTGFSNFLLGLTYHLSYSISKSGRLSSNYQKFADPQQAREYFSIALNLEKNGYLRGEIARRSLANIEFERVAKDEATYIRKNNTP